MALEIGQVAGGFGIFSVRQANQVPGDAAAAIETEVAAPQEQAPPLTGVAACLLRRYSDTLLVPLLCPNSHTGTANFV